MKQVWRAKCMCQKGNAYVHDYMCRCWDSVSHVYIMVFHHTGDLRHFDMTVGCAAHYAGAALILFWTVCATFGLLWSDFGWSWRFRLGRVTFVDRKATPSTLQPMTWAIFLAACLTVFPFNFQFHTFTIDLWKRVPDQDYRFEKEYRTKNIFVVQLPVCFPFEYEYGKILRANVQNGLLQKTISQQPLGLWQLISTPL